MLLPPGFEAAFDFEILFSSYTRFGQTTNFRRNRLTRPLNIRQCLVSFINTYRQRSCYISNFFFTPQTQCLTSASNLTHSAYKFPDPFGSSEPFSECQKYYKISIDSRAKKIISVFNVWSESLNYESRSPNCKEHLFNTVQLFSTFCSSITSNFCL